MLPFFALTSNQSKQGSAKQTQQDKKTNTLPSLICTYIKKTVLIAKFRSAIANHRLLVETIVKVPRILCQRG